MTRRARLSMLLAALTGGAVPALAAPGPEGTAPLPVPAHWPGGDAYPAEGTAPAPTYSYRQVMSDPRLVALIDTALAHNQDVAAALANIEAYRAQYRIQHAALLPEIDASAGWTRAGGDGRSLAGAATKGDSFAVEGSMASYEVDLFGRLRDLDKAARARLLQSEAAARSVRLSLVADVADGWLAYAADASLLQVARDTAANARAAVDLTARRVRGGIAPLSDQRKAELTLRGAEADVAAQTAALAQDVNALRLLVGADIAPGNLPSSIEDAGAHLAEVPAGLDSSILLRRPDVMQAEFALAAAHAQVGAARAALFPKITLTGLLGVASTALSSLFTGGSFAWAAGSSLTYPIFRGGAGKANVKLNQAQADAALAAWRKAVQSAFADVADALARRGTIEAQLTATSAARDAAADNYRLVDRRYRGGVTSYLDSLSAEQTLYTYEKTLVATHLARAANLVALYRALGGDAPGEAGSASPNR